jgi:hypothetical protein
MKVGIATGYVANLGEHLDHDLPVNKLKTSRNFPFAQLGQGTMKPGGRYNRCLR